MQCGNAAAAGGGRGTQRQPPRTSTSPDKSGITALFLAMQKGAQQSQLEELEWIGLRYGLYCLDYVLEGHAEECPPCVPISAGT